MGSKDVTSLFFVEIQVGERGIWCIDNLSYSSRGRCTQDQIQITSSKATLVIGFVGLYITWDL